MKKIIALLLALTMVLSSMSVFALANPDDSKNNLCIMGKVDFSGNTKIALALEDEDGRTMYFKELDCVRADGNYNIAIKYSGDITKRVIKVTYNGVDVTSGIKSATSVTDLKAADFNDGVIDTAEKFFYEEGQNSLVVSYDESGKLLKAEVVTDAEIKIPDNASNVKAFCWNTIMDATAFSKSLEGLMPKIDVFCIGDSFGQTWPEKWYPESGWGTHIGDYFNDRTTTINFCTSGGWAQAIMSNEEDPKYQQNIAEGKKATDSMWGWDDWKDMEKSNRYSKGDYVIVSLGLNDAKREGPNGMDPVEWYGMAIEEMAKRTAEKGVNLILCSPLHRATLKLDQTTKLFASKTEEIAKKYGLVYINAFEALNKQYNKEFKTDDEILRKYYLHREELMKPVEQGGWGLTAEQIENHGQESMRPGKSGKNEHPNIKGADNFARTMVELIKETDSGLKEYIK